MPSTPRLILHTDSGAYSAAVLSFLEEREAENGLFIGVLTGAIKGPPPLLPQPVPTVPPPAPAPAPFLAEIRIGERISCAAIYVAKNLVLTRSLYDPAAAAGIFATALREAHIDVPGVVGPSREVAAFVETWKAVRGCQAKLAMDLRLYQLTEVNPPVDVPGQMRAVTLADLDCVTEWMYQFGVEAIPEETGTRAGARQGAEMRIQQGKLFLWEVAGKPVAMAALSRESRHGITVNAVYTPPENRRHGYATALVAAVSAEGLRRGKTFCVLYTDLSNPTSNSIYQKIGYRPVSDSNNFQFQY